MKKFLHRVLSCGVLACTVLAVLVACGGTDIVNSKPVAVAGDLVTVDVGETVSLDASASTDADGNTLDYHWTFESRPEGSTASFVDPQALTTTFMPDKAGVYRIGLVVNDGSVDSNKSIKIVQVLHYLVSFCTDSGRTILQTVQVGLPSYRLPLVPEEPENPGYLFVGWFTQAGGEGDRVSPGLVIDENLVVYDYWSSYAYTISFDGQGATTAPSPATLLVSSPYNSLAGLPANPAKTGYHFGGWYTEPNGGGSVVTPESTFTADATVYAKWDSYSYTVTFNSGDATTPASPANVEVSSPATSCPSLPAAPARTNYVFDGWYTQAEGQGTAFDASTPVTGDLTVHAKWVDYDYTVTFDSAGATTAATPATLVVGSTEMSLGSLPAAPVKTGYLFGGWYTEPNGDGTRVTASSAFTRDITVYAKWDSYRYLVVFNDSGATVPVGTASIAVESPARFVGSLPAAPAKSGYAFGGWFTEPNGAGEPFTATTIVTDTLAVYAHWTFYSWTVTFNAPEATTAPGFASKTIASPQTLLGTLPAAPARTGYLFGGWYTGPDGSGMAVTATSALSGNTELHAKWNSYTYTVAFDSAGADSPASPASKTVASPATTAGTLPAAPVRTGFTFSGWYTAPNGSGTAFTAASPVVGDMTVYAKWLPNSAVSVEVSIPGSGPVTILNDNPVVSKGSTVNVRVAQTGYERYQWYLDGVLQGAAGSTISINTSAMEAGVHSLMVVIADSQGAGASASCRFTIEN